MYHSCRKAICDTYKSAAEIQRAKESGPEYESVKKLCEAAGVPFKVVYQAACEAEINE